MSHLALTRRVGSFINLRLDAHADPERLLDQLATEGVNVYVVGIRCGKVLLSFEAPMDINIVRGELLEESVV